MTIGLLYDRFLPLSETFLLHEWRALNASSLPLKTYALDPLPPERACATAAEIAATERFSLSLGGLAFKTGFYLRHPVRGGTLGVAVLAATARAQPGGLFGPTGLAHLWRANSAFDLVRRLQRDGITHLHASFLGLPATLAWIAHRLIGVPYSISAHARDVWAEDFAVPAKIAAADRVFVCNEAARQELLRRFPTQATKFILAPHGLPLDEAPPAAPATPTAASANEPPPPAWTQSARFKLLAVGRLVEKKGFGYLISALDILRQHGLELGLAIAGAGPLLHELGAKIRDLKLTDRVDLLGAQPAGRIHQLMGQADLLVVPSIIAPDNDRDGLPNVILEAFEAGLPVLGTPVGGIPEVVIPERTGFIAFDYYPSGLVQAIHQAVTLPAPLRKTLAINARFWLHENREISTCVAPLLNYLREHAGAAPAAPTPVAAAPSAP
ncbi:MAG: glycosyltransferase family 4 protein [Planctomycetota bacterium]